MRPGSITLEQLISTLGHSVFHNSLLPSHDLKHYTLNKKCVLVYYENNEKLINKINDIIKEYTNPVIISSFENKDKYNCNNIVSISSKTDLQEFSKNIFTTLHNLENTSYDAIIIEGIKPSGLGVAIFNRLIYTCNDTFLEM